MYHSYGFELGYALEELGLALIPGLISSVPSGLFGLAAYILTAIALYTAAKRRGIRKPWLAWIPVLNCWILGALSDQYRYVVKGQVKSKRKALLTLNLINAGLTVVILVIILAVIVGFFTSNYFAMNEEEVLELVFVPLVSIVALSVPLIGISIAILVIRYMALYDVYTSMDPGNNVLYLVLSVLVSVTEPFFLFFNREKDLGMPPRKQRPVQTPVYEDHQEYETVAEDHQEYETVDENEYL